MSKETIDTTNKFILPSSGDAGIDEARKQIVENLQKITPEQARAVGEELAKKQKELQQQQEKRHLEVVQSLLDFREVWGKVIDYSAAIKEQIIKASEKIPVNIEKDDNGNRIIKLSVGEKIYTIVDVNVEKYSDIGKIGKYTYNNSTKTGVYDSGCTGDSLGSWDNKSLAKYVDSQKANGLYIPKQEDFKKFLDMLGKQTDLDDEKVEVALLMYLTGLHGCYKLMDGYVRFGLNSRGLKCTGDGDGKVNIFLMSR